MSNPRIRRVIPLSTSSFEVLFDQPMQENAALTNVANYRLSVVSGGSLPISTSAVVATNEATVVVMTSREFTFGEIYNVEVRNVTSTDFELIDSNFDSVEFQGVTIRPMVVSAVAQNIERDRFEIALTFSEPMGGDSILNPLNYNVLSVTANRTLKVSSVQQTAATQVTLKIADKLTNNGVVEVFISNIEDVAGNRILSNSQIRLLSVNNAIQHPRTTDVQVNDEGHLVISFDTELRDSPLIRDRANFSIRAQNFNQNPEGMDFTQATLSEDRKQLTLDTSEGTNGFAYRVFVGNNVTDDYLNPTSNDQVNFTGVGSPPYIRGVQSRGRNIARIVFSEPIKDSIDVRDPSSYVFDGLETLSVVNFGHLFIDVSTSSQVVGETYSLTISSNRQFTDLALNALINPADPLTDPMFVMLAEGAETPVDPSPRDMYRFVSEEIRNIDRRLGGLFLQRFLAGPQIVWAQIHESIQSLYYIFDPLRTRGDLLKYLRTDNGWTRECDQFTDTLSEEQLRLLLVASHDLWGFKATTDGYLDVLNVFVGDLQSEVVEWFDIRWILEDRSLEDFRAHLLYERRDGDDVWLLDESQERVSNVRIVDQPGLDKWLIVGLLNKWRPSGERISVTWLHFFDRFRYDDILDLQRTYDILSADDSPEARVAVNSDSIDVNPFTNETITFSPISDKSHLWGASVSYLKAEMLPSLSVEDPGALFSTTLRAFVDPDTSSAYAFRLRLRVSAIGGLDQSAEIVKTVGGTDTVLASVNISQLNKFVISTDSWPEFDMRFSAIASSSRAVELQAYVHNELIMTAVDQVDPFEDGSADFQCASGQHVRIYEYEVMQDHAQYRPRLRFVDINS